MSHDEDKFINEVREIFSIEAREHLETIEEILLKLEKDPENDSLIDHLFRIMHTLKGGASAAHINSIANLSHEMEALLHQIREKKATLDHESLALFFESVDLITKVLYDQDLSGKSEDFSGYINKFKKYLTKEALRQHTDKNTQLSSPDTKVISIDKSQETFERSQEMPLVSESSVASPPQNIKERTEEETEEIRVQDFPFHNYELGSDLDDFSFYHIKLLQDFPEGSQKLQEIIRILLNYAIVIQCLTARGEIVDDPSFIADYVENGVDILVATRLSDSELLAKMAVSSRILSQCDHQIVLSNSDSGMIFLDTPRLSSKPEPEHEEIKDPELSALKPSIPPDQDALLTSLIKKSSTIRIRVEILDHLMRLASELVLVRNQQLKMVDREQDEARASTQRLDAITTEIQSQIMATRMQPIGNIFSKFNRIVRDLALRLGKTIELSTSGGDVELDKTILENLADPLMHIVRNCCDHGIEDSRTRVKNKKSVSGHISLRAFHEGGLVNIEIKDDGAGISPANIRKKALKNGLRSQSELHKMTDRELLHLIFLPGFSTAEEVTDISGRGVGMDVVKVSIEKLGGNIDIKSEVQKGTQIFLRLPLTLAIIPCLIIECEGQMFAIPQVNLEELITLGKNSEEEKLEHVGHVEVYRIRDTLLPIVRLSKILKGGLHTKYQEKVHHEEENQEENQDKNRIVYFVVLKTGDKKFGLVVDNIIGTEEVVISPMHSALKDIRIYSGATVRGDGQVSLILDAFGISEYSGISGLEDTKEEGSMIKPDLIPTTLKEEPLLIFSTNDKEQLAINQKDVQRVLKIPYSDLIFMGHHVTTPVDATFTYVLFLEKYLALSEHLKKEEIFLIIPKQFRIPIGIYATRISDADQFHAFEINQFYNQEGVTGSSMIKGQLTYHISIAKFVKKCEKDLITDAAEKQLSMIS